MPPPCSVQQLTLIMTDVNTNVKMYSHHCSELCEGPLYIKNKVWLLVHWWQNSLCTLGCLDLHSSALLHMLSLAGCKVFSLLPEFLCIFHFTYINSWKWFLPWSVPWSLDDCLWKILSAMSSLQTPLTTILIILPISNGGYVFSLTVWQGAPFICKQ